MIFRNRTARRQALAAGALTLVFALSVPAIPAAAGFLFTPNGKALSLTPVRDTSPTDAYAITLEEAAAQLEAENAEESEEEVKAGKFEFMPHVWPVRFSASGLITSYFGGRVDPVTGDCYEFHSAIDLADNYNSKIYAAASGTVIEADYYGGYGLTLVIDHGNGYTTRYSHCSSLLYDVGDEVKQGEIIAMMGNSGYVTGTHLDFRVTLNGEFIDPLTVLDPME